MSCLKSPGFLTLALSSAVAIAVVLVISLISNAVSDKRPRYDPKWSDFLRYLAAKSQEMLASSQSEQNHAIALNDLNYAILYAKTLIGFAPREEINRLLKFDIDEYLTDLHQIEQKRLGVAM